jgi:hypothetical protein
MAEAGTSMVAAINAALSIFIGRSPHLSGRPARFGSGLVAAFPKVRENSAAVPIRRGRADVGRVVLKAAAVEMASASSG